MALGKRAWRWRKRAWRGAIVKVARGNTSIILVSVITDCNVYMVKHVVGVILESFTLKEDMSLRMRKPTIWVSDQV